MIEWKKFSVFATKSDTFTLKMTDRILTEFNFCQRLTNKVKHCAFVLYNIGFISAFINPIFNLPSFDEICTGVFVYHFVSFGLLPCHIGFAWNFQVESIKSSMKVHLYTHKDGRIWLCFFICCIHMRRFIFILKHFAIWAVPCRLCMCVFCSFTIFFSCTKQSYPLSISPNKSIALTQITMNAIDHWDSSIKTYVSLCHFIYSTVWLKWHLYIYCVDFFYCNYCCCWFEFISFSLSMYLIFTLILVLDSGLYIFTER